MLFIISYEAFHRQKFSDTILFPVSLQQYVDSTSAVLVDDERGPYRQARSLQRARSLYIIPETHQAPKVVLKYVEGVRVDLAERME